MRAFQFDNLGVALVLWVIFYMGDYYLTLLGNRLRKQYAQAHIGFDGSYELNPTFQPDIDSMRRLSPRFLVYLLTFAIYLILAWWVADSLALPELFTVVAGYLLLMEIGVMLQHAQNIVLFNFMKTPGSVEGHIQYARWVSVGLGARNFAMWGLVCLMMFFLSGSWLFFGGALSGLSVFVRFQRLSNKLRQMEKPAQAALQEAA